jgi:dihydropteroate synthase
LKDQRITLNCKGQLLVLDSPKVMGILNLTPDSFFDGGKWNSEDAILKQTERMLQEGATIIDVGGLSTRPGSVEVSIQEESDRVCDAISKIKKAYPETLISIDTYRSEVAKNAVQEGASIINDVSGGNMDRDMFPTVAALNTPYILMHMQGSPQTMQDNPQYEDVTKEVLDFFIKKIEMLRALSVKDIVLDPGFGFGKTLEHGYTLLNQMHVFQILELPILAGISRKSMICKALRVNPENALNGTTALHMVALQQGAKILRVHDVKEAVEVIKLFEMLQANP